MYGVQTFGPRSSVLSAPTGSGGFPGYQTRESFPALPGGAMERGNLGPSARKAGALPFPIRQRDIGYCLVLSQTCSLVHCCLHWLAARALQGFRQRSLFLVPLREAVEDFTWELLHCRARVVLPLSTPPPSRKPFLGTKYILVLVVPCLFLLHCCLSGICPCGREAFPFRSSFLAATFVRFLLCCMEL